jgi:hypothetical protein
MRRTTSTVLLGLVAALVTSAATVPAASAAPAASTGQVAASAEGDYTPPPVRWKRCVE